MLSPVKIIKPETRRKIQEQEQEQEHGRERVEEDARQKLGRVRYLDTTSLLPVVHVLVLFYCYVIIQPYLDRPQKKRETND
jgi:hypothetical protein